MQKFDLLRYLKRFGLLVLAITLVGTAGVYYYCKNNQTYTAKATIRYTNDNINQGMNPDGTELDVDEIYSSAVIAQAMEQLGLTTSLNVVRSKCYVEGIIPEDEQTKQEALLDKGEEVNYTPDTYEVGLTVSGSRGSSYASNVLDAILQSYFNVYTEKHVEQRLELNPSSNLLKNGYDFYECIYILEDDTSEMLSYLKAKKDDYPNYRSSVTGYSYTDLYMIYKEFSDYMIPSLYAKVIDGPQVIDGDILRKSLSNQIKDMQRDEATKSERRAYLFGLITGYSDKYKEILNYHFHSNDDSPGNDYILKNVEETRRGDIENTYDKLILEYVSLDKAIRQSEVNRKFKEDLLTIFGAIGSGGSGTEEEHAALAAMINDYESTLYRYYNIVSETSREFNNVLSANYLKMQSSITVSQAINTKMYLAIGFVFFLIAGIVVAVIFGRAGDFAKYLLYTDKKTGLANREQIDVYIDKMSKDILPDNYACIYLVYSALFDHTKRYGYKVADNILKDFSGLVNAMGDDNSFIGYNGAGRFVIFSPQCNAKRADTIIGVFDKQVEEYNNINPDYKMEYQAAYAVTSDEGTYEIRGIFRAAMNKIQQRPNRDKKDGEAQPDKKDDQPKTDPSGSSESAQAEKTDHAGDPQQTPAQDGGEQK